MLNGKIHLKLRLIRIDRFWCLRQGLPSSQQQRQKGIRHKGHSHKQVQREQKIGGMHC